MEKRGKRNARLASLWARFSLDSSLFAAFAFCPGPVEAIDQWKHSPSHKTATAVFWGLKAFYKLWGSKSTMSAQASYVAL